MSIGNYSQIGIKRSRLGLVSFLVPLCIFLTACVEQSSKTDSTQDAFWNPASQEEISIAAAQFVSSKPAFPRGGGHKKLGRPYQISGQWYYPKIDPDYSETGVASWYGHPFHGKKTANGETYDMDHLTAAHPTMPLPSYARVTNLANGSSIIVRINDRGPFAKDRIIDLSRKAAEMLDYKHRGIAQVRVEYISPAPLEGTDDSYLLTSYKPGKSQSPTLLALKPKAEHSKDAVGAVEQLITTENTPETLLSASASSY